MVLISLYFLELTINTMSRFTIVLRIKGLKRNVCKGYLNFANKQQFHKILRFCSGFNMTIINKKITL